MSPIRSRYTLDELARALNRSRMSLMRDIEMGRFPLERRENERRRGGPGMVHHVSARDVEGYLGRTRARQLLEGRELPKGETAPLPERQEREAAKKARLKRCVTCRKILTTREFRHDESMPDKLASSCNDCVSRHAERQRRRKKRQP